MTTAKLNMTAQKSKQDRQKKKNKTAPKLNRTTAEGKQDRTRK